MHLIKPTFYTLYSQAAFQVGSYMPGTFLSFLENVMRLQVHMPSGLYTLYTGDFVSQEWRLVNFENKYNG